MPRNAIRTPAGPPNSPYRTGIRDMATSMGGVKLARRTVMIDASPATNPTANLYETVVLSPFVVHPIWGIHQAVAHTSRMCPEQKSRKRQARTALHREAIRLLFELTASSIWRQRFFYVAHVTEPLSFGEFTVN